MNTKEQNIAAFKAIIKKIPKRVRLQWISKLKTSTKITGVFRSLDPGKCERCVLGALQDCRLANGELISEYGLSSLQDKYQISPTFGDSLFDVATSLNDNQLVTFPEFITMIRDSLHA